MTATDYSVATPDVAITYDALGRQHTVQSAVAQSQRKRGLKLMGSEYTE